MLEVRYAKRRDPRVRARQVKAGIARKTRLLRSDARAAIAVLDLSASGMKLVVGLEPPLAKGDDILIELLHPAFRGAVLLDAVVRWVRAETADRRSAGVEFAKLEERAKRQLDRLIALELGSAASVKGRPVGWVARGSGVLARTLFVYDLDRNELARIVEEKGRCHATRVREGGKVEDRAGTRDELLAWVFGGEVTVEPAL